MMMIEYFDNNDQIVSNGHLAELIYRNISNIDNLTS